MDWWKELDKQAADYLPELRMVCDEPMSGHTSFRIGGPAKRMAFPTCGEELVLLLNFARACGANPLVIGNGSNLLAADEGLNRLVISTMAMKRVEMGEKPHTIRADAGATLARVATFACEMGLTGLEFAHGIPGTVGGAVCMNAGAYDGEMKLVLLSATVLFPEEGIRVLPVEELRLDYRRSILTERPDAVVLHAEFGLQPGNPETIRETMRLLMERRKKSQPLEYPSAGSTFKRPAGHFAGTLIDQCGWKGKAVGGAQVSAKHAGFVINAGGATFTDVTELMAQVQADVLEKTGVRLEPEVKIIR